MKLKHYAGIYLLIGAAATAYNYTKVKALVPKLIVTWPLNIGAIMGAGVPS
jgi:hypothetical protein